MAEQPAAGAQSGGMLSGEPSGLRSKLSGGSPAIDMILGGGLPRASLHILTGPPGAGKTILAQQFAFAAAKQNLHVIYFTNVSEPHAKLVEHIQQFTFYTPALIGEKIQIYNITSQIRNAGFRETLDFIVETVRSERADLVVIDSFRGLKHVLDVSVRDRSAIFDLAAQLSILGCTSLLVGEYMPYELQTDPEFAIADGIINLWHATEGTQDRRTLRISKMRGVRYLGGEHSFVIGSSGIEAFPRQEALTQAPRYNATTERVSLGIPSLDLMMRGGPIRSSSTLLAGSAGTGKTVLSMHFLAAGLACGERGLMVSFQENPEQLALRASQFGLGETFNLSNEQIQVLFLSPVELDLDMAASYIRQAVEQGQARRVVIDSVAELEFAVRDPERFDDFLASLVGFFRGHEVTTLMTREIPQLFGSDLTISSRGLSYIVDNIILLRYIELDAQIQRALSVLKIRGSDHDKSLRQLHMVDGRVSVGERFKHLSGLVTGIPQLAAGAQPRPAEERHGAS